MKKNFYEVILNNILETKKTAVIVFDLNLKILFLSDISKKIAANKMRTEDINDFYKEFKADDYEKAILTGLSSDKKIKKINKCFYLSTLSPIKENGKVIGILEILEAEEESFNMSNEIKNIHLKAYEIGELDNTLNLNNGTVYNLDSIITKDINLINLIEKAYKTASSSSPVLIYGETGTGKELFAQGIHNASSERKTNMFIAQNCAAIPDTLLESLLFGTTEGSFTGAKDKPGLFEIAEGGTIYLDEINSMNLNLQAKLLRVLQENTYMSIGGKTIKTANVRVIASFNEEPIQVIKKGKFRRDLYYRLNVIYFKIPNLKDRGEDIKLLANYFIKIYNKKFHKNILGITEEAMKIFEKFNWEGNVRELKNNIERIMNFIEGDFIKIEDISDFIVKDSIEKDSDQLSDGKDMDAENTLNQSISNDFSYIENDERYKTFSEKLEYVEKSIIKKALTSAEGNVALAARNLDLPRQTLKNKIMKYNIKPNF